MQAIQFQTQPHDGRIELPIQYQHWNGKSILVILLTEADESETLRPTEPTFDAIAIKTQGFRFNREEANER